MKKIKKAVRYDKGKVGYHLFPTPDALAELHRVAEYGAQKYAAHNWAHGMDWDKMYNSLKRHLDLFWWGHEDRNPDDGDVYHLAQAAWGCLALLHYQLAGKGIDNRPPAGLYPVEVIRAALYPPTKKTKTRSR